jgi:hypothetical protein
VHKYLILSTTRVIILPTSESRNEHCICTDKRKDRYLHTLHLECNSLINPHSTIARGLPRPSSNIYHSIPRFQYNFPKANTTTDFWVHIPGHNEANFRSEISRIKMATGHASPFVCLHDANDISDANS